MGASSFIDSAIGETASQAYNAAVEQAQFEFGHNTYNGTISTTGGYKMVPMEEGETLEEWEHRVLDMPDIRKWEDCACTKSSTRPDHWIFAGWAAE